MFTKRARYKKHQHDYQQEWLSFFLNDQVEDTGKVPWLSKSKEPKRIYPISFNTSLYFSAFQGSAAIDIEYWKLLN